MCVCVFCLAMYSSANGDRKRRRGEMGRGAGDGLGEASGAPTVPLASGSYFGVNS